MVLTELWSSLAEIFALQDSDLSVWFGNLAQLDAIFQAVLVFIILVLGRWLYDRVTPFPLAKVLTKSDNKALAFSFASYMAGLCIVIAGVYRNDATFFSGTPGLISSLSDTLLWGVLGAAFLILAQVLNDRLILSKWNNYQQIIECKNLAVGIAEGASYIASALLLYGTMQGASASFLVDFLLTILYFFISQLSLILFAKIFIRLKSWELHGELERKNPAAAISFAFALINFALLLSVYMANYDSIVGLVLSAIAAVLWLSLLHFLVDKMIFPKVALADEIAKDQNWGAALIEGTVITGLSVVLMIAFSS